MIWTLIAPAESLKILEKLMIVTKEGTAQGNKKMIPKILLPFIQSWCATVAVKTPKIIWSVEAINVQINVQLKTAIGAQKEHIFEILDPDPVDQSGWRDMVEVIVSECHKESN